MADIHIPSITEIAPWATALIPRETLMTADDLSRLSHDDPNLYELVEGRLVQMPPPKPKHGKIVFKVGFILGQHVLVQNLGTIYAAETGFLIGQNPDTVLAPDVAFVAAGREQGADEEGYFPFAPDLVVEVASPDQFRPEMRVKAQLWLAGGARLVWLIWPKTQQVDVWQPDKSVRTLKADAMIDGVDVLPNFTCRISEFFA
jgi:Uma2 family endonuclease